MRARRVFAFALIIRNGIPVSEVEQYLHARAWVTDAARLLGRTPESLAAELIDTMVRSGAIIIRDNRLHAAAEHTPVATASLRGAVAPDMAAYGPDHEHAEPASQRPLLLHRRTQPDGQTQHRCY